MRKLDYTLLAELIRQHNKVDIVRKLAEIFASRASVDKTKFLAACGIIGG